MPRIIYTDPQDDEWILTDPSYADLPGFIKSPAKRIPNPNRLQRGPDTADLIVPIGSRIRIEQDQKGIKK